MAGFMKSALKLFGLDQNAAGGGKISLEDFLQHLPEALGYDVKFERTPKEGTPNHFEVTGPDSEALMGKSSEVLDALAHLSMRVLRKERGLSNEPGEENDGSLRVTFDANGFRERKSEDLKKLAESQRAKVIETGGKPAYVPAMGPADRKVIHTHLASLGEVNSESIGRGTFKRIRITLKDDSQHRREQPPRAEGEAGNSEQRETRPFGAEGGGRGGRRRRGGRGRGGQNRQGGQGQRGNGNYGQPRFNQTAEGGDDDFGNRIAPNDAPQDHIEEADDNIGNRLDSGNNYGSGTGKRTQY